MANRSGRAIPPIHLHGPDRQRHGDPRSSSIAAWLSSSFQRRARAIHAQLQHSLPPQAPGESRSPAKRPTAWGSTIPQPPGQPRGGSNPQTGPSSSLRPRWAAVGQWPEKPSARGATTLCQTNKKARPAIKRRAGRSRRIQPSKMRQARPPRPSAKAGSGAVGASSSRAGPSKPPISALVHRPDPRDTSKAEKGKCSLISAWSSREVDDQQLGLRLGLGIRQQL